MTQNERLKLLNQYLLNEMPQYREQAEQFGNYYTEQFRLFRSLVNVRPPMAAKRDFLTLQDEFLKEETKKKGITCISELTPLREDIYIWQGDITALRCDAIVNAANSRMLGCFCPCHECIDNAIHTYAGVQLRLSCANLMKEQGHEEPEGKAKITYAFNLPSKYVLHTVGPIICGNVGKTDEEILASCYCSCLELAEKNNVGSIAFCCISTGEFHFPNRPAAKIAIDSVSKHKDSTESKIKVIFNVFKDIDYEIYSDLLR